MMKTSPFSRVSASVPVGKKSKFNLSHDVNTTYDWGSVQPLFGKMMLPDSSINLNTEQLTRLAPMVVPTFGRVKLKNIAHFVPLQEIWPNWDAMMSQTKVTRTAGSAPSAVTYVPKTVPYVKNSYLAAWCLAGAKVNLYFSDTVDPNKWYCAHNTGTYSTPAGWVNATLAGREFFSYVLNVHDLVNIPDTNLGYTGAFFNVRRLILDSSNSVLPGLSAGDVFDLPTISTVTPRVLPNSNGTGFTHSANWEDNVLDTDVPSEHVSMEGADMIWEYSGSSGTGITSSDRAAASTGPLAGFEGSTYSHANHFDGRSLRLVFRLSSFGKRLRKILIGLGYDVNLLNDDDVSVLPLIAFYKSWWDSYAPERFRNFYETSAWKLVNMCMWSATATNLAYQFDQSTAQNYRAIFRQFMFDLGTCFATEKMDVISAATDNYYGATNTTASTLGTGSVSSIQTVIEDTLANVLKNPTDSVSMSGETINADGSANSILRPANNNSLTNSEFLSMVLRTQITGHTLSTLTQPQVDSLKKAYMMLNKSSVAGMKVEEILRALGHGDYVEECKGKFISSSDDNIKISDVVATAATDGADLGQYGGRGIGYGKFQFSYSTNRYGYLVVLSAIVPESGYVNSPVHENEAISFEKMYQPELDGLAYEAIQKKQLTGSPLISDGSYRQTFGFLPTYSQWKFMTNKSNGDFSLNSRKMYMLPYTLDKNLPVSNANVYRVGEVATSPGSEVVSVSPRFTFADLPNAGEDYRYINKFPWNGDFNRIFAEQDDGYEWSVFSPNNTSFLFNSFEYDNFMTHNVFQVSYYAHMKPIEDSYGTYDEEHGAPNTSISRS